MRTLLRLQEVDLRIEAYKARELEIPKQKGKLEVYRKRLAAELEEREKTCRALALEQRECEGEIEQMQDQIAKYDKQLFSVKKNEEYQALLHEMDLVKKQIGLKEERVIAIMMDLDDARARLEEDRKRIAAEMQELDRQAAGIDAELQEAVEERELLEEQCGPLEREVDPALIALYKRVRSAKKTGPAVVPLKGEVCTGCNMHIPAQMVNEVLAGEKAHACIHCGRLLYDKENVKDISARS